jgi:penicillin-binding protein 1B
LRRKNGISWRVWLLANRRTVVLSGLVLVLSALLAAFSLHARHLSLIVQKQFEGKRWSLPSKIYSDSFLIYPGQNVRGIRLTDRLERLGYHPVTGRITQPGEYHVSAGRMDIFLHEFTYPDREVRGYPVRLLLQDGQIRKIMNPSDEEEPLVELEPELISALYADTWEERRLVRLDEVSPWLIQAVLAVEDSRFFEHFGLDPRGIARAAWVNLKNFRIVQGGSTITQQLVKNFYLTNRKTLSRKFDEAIMALLLERNYSKDEILEAYLNEVYFGQNGRMGIYGVGEASRYYFGKKPKNLTLGEAALLAGVLNSPNLFSPFHDPERSAKRQVVVLDRMRKLGMISGEDYADALTEKFPDHPPAQQRRRAPYFVDYVRQQLEADYPPEALISDGLRIFTTLDSEQQIEAEASLKTGLDRLEARFPKLKRKAPEDRLQGLIVVLQPQTGYIRAMVGGRDYSVSQFNRVAQARRQPGSLFKLFVYAAALSRETGSAKPPYTLASLIDDTPLTIETPNGTWSPENYDRTFNGPVTLRTALEKSLNVATVRLARDVGIDRVVDLAHAAGIRTPLDAVPSLALGTSEVIPLEMASAYNTIANGGIRAEPIAVKAVVTPDGEVLERRNIEMTQVMTPQQAYLLTDLLEGVAERGTARTIQKLNIDRPVAGKTGTSNNYRDAWFAGFTPELFSLVWIGFDQYDSSGAGRRAVVPLTGANAALPIWADFIKQADRGIPPSDFVAPPGIVVEKVDPQTGRVAGLGCPEGVTEVFIRGTEPESACNRPGRVARGILNWFKKVLSIE